MLSKQRVTTTCTLAAVEHSFVKVLEKLRRNSRSAVPLPAVPASAAPAWAGTPVWIGAPIATKRDRTITYGQALRLDCGPFSRKIEPSNRARSRHIIAEKHSRQEPPPLSACAHVHVHIRMPPNSDAWLAGQPEASVVKAGAHGTSVNGRNPKRIRFDMCSA